MATIPHHLTHCCSLVTPVAALLDFFLKQPPGRVAAAAVHRVPCGPGRPGQQLFIERNANIEFVLPT